MNSKNSKEHCATEISGDDVVTTSSSSIQMIVENIKNLNQQYTTFTQHSQNRLESLVEDNNIRDFKVLKQILTFLHKIDRKYYPKHEDPTDHCWDELTQQLSWEEIPDHLNPKNILLLKLLLLYIYIYIFHHK